MANTPWGGGQAMEVPTAEVLTVELTMGQFKHALKVWGEYSCTLPTGTSYGKKWYCNRDAYSRSIHAAINKAEAHMLGAFPDWWQGEYFELDSTEYVGIRWRKVVIVKGAEDG